MKEELFWVVPRAKRQVLVTRVNDVWLDTTEITSRKSHFFVCFMPVEHLTVLSTNRHSAYPLPILPPRAIQARWLQNHEIDIFYIQSPPSYIYSPIHPLCNTWFWGWRAWLKKQILLAGGVAVGETNQLTHRPTHPATYSPTNSHVPPRPPCELCSLTHIAWQGNVGGGWCWRW